MQLTGLQPSCLGVGPSTLIARLAVAALLRLPAGNRDLVPLGSQNPENSVLGERKHDSPNHLSEFLDAVDAPVPEFGLFPT